MVKETLKKYGITLIEFAANLNISRPTLDTYIKLYEANQSLPNEKYVVLFDSLFKDDVKSAEEFSEKMKKASYLLERDSVLGTFELDTNKTDILTNIIETAKKDMYKESCDLDLYRFITLFMNSYYDNPVFKYLVKYFLMLNGLIDSDDMSKEDETVLSNYYILFKAQLEDELRLDTSHLSEFKRRIKQIKDEKNEQNQALKQKVYDSISERIEQILSQGIDVNNIDISKLLRNYADSSDSQN